MSDEHQRLTFTVERRGVEFWLCTTDGIKEITIAKFACEAAVQSFNDVLAAGKSVAYAMGQSGI